MQNFIFGGNTGKTYADMNRAREIAKALVADARGTPRNVGEGINAIGSAILARSQQRRADSLRDELANIVPPDHPVFAQLFGLPAYRFGTPYHPGGPAIVGENGPEVVALPRGAQVIPTPEDLMRMQREAQADGNWNADNGLDALMDRYPSGLPQTLPDADSQLMDAIMDSLGGGQPVLPQQQPSPMRGNSFNDAGQYDVAQMALTDALNDPNRSGFDEKLTGEQSKDVVYFRRGVAANELLNGGLEDALLSFGDTLAGKLGTAGRYFQDAQYQQAKRAADEFLAIVLRKDTGAAVTKQEWDFYAPMYIPMPGDKPETVAAKRRAREEFLIGMSDAAGSARPIMVNAGNEIANYSNDMTDEEFMNWLQNQ